jgi:hypothetical protein
MKKLLSVCALGCLWQNLNAAEHSVPPDQRYDRIVCIAPLIGAGSFADPKRPLFAPVRPESDGILAFSFQPTDNANSAIVEFVARSPKALKAIQEDSRVRCFSPDKNKKDDVEKELKKARKDFDFTKFGTRVQ